MAITNENNIKFYEAVSRLLTNKMKEESLTVSQVSNKVGQQFNTVNAIVKGVPFYAHQMMWLMSELNISVEDVIREMNGEVDTSGGYGGGPANDYQEETTLDDLI